MGAAHVIEQLRLIATELQLATVRASVNRSMLTAFENFSDFAPAERQVTVVHAMLDQLVAWSRTPGARCAPDRPLTTQMRGLIRSTTLATP